MTTNLSVWQPSLLQRDSVFADDDRSCSGDKIFLSWVPLNLVNGQVLALLQAIYLPQRYGNAVGYS